MSEKAGDEFDEEERAKKERLKQVTLRLFEELLTSESKPFSILSKYKDTDTVREQLCVKCPYTPLACGIHLAKWDDDPLYRIVCPGMMAEAKGVLEKGIVLPEFFLILQWK